MNNRLDWDDLRVVLAVAEAGSLSGAARRLRVSHATAFRRLGAIEARVGAALFHRTRTGYAPTPAGEAVAMAARRVATTVDDLERRIVGRDLTPEGTVRITAPDSVFAGLLAPILGAIRAVHPGIAVEVALSHGLFDLSRREADIALRAADAAHSGASGRAFRRHPVGRSGVSGHREVTLPSAVF